MLFRVGFICVLLATTALAACGGGAVQSRGPDGPSWSLTDKKPQGLGGAPNSVPTPTANGPYEYRGGRDAVTGQARTIQGTPAGSGPAMATAAGGRRTVEVRKGDTLHGLSLQHHVSVEALMAANNLATPKIVLGQHLIVPPSR
jgi:LysM repeat protein